MQTHWDASLVNNHGSIFFLRPCGNTSRVNGLFLKQVGLTAFEVDGAVVETPHDETLKPSFFHEPGRTRATFRNYVKPFISLTEEIIATGGDRFVLRYTLLNSATEAKELGVRFCAETDRPCQKLTSEDGIDTFWFELGNLIGDRLPTSDFKKLRFWFIEETPFPVSVQLPGDGKANFEVQKVRQGESEPLYHRLESEVRIEIPSGESVTLDVLVNYGVGEADSDSVENAGRMAWENFVERLPVPRLENEEEKAAFYQCWQVLRFNEVERRGVKWCLTSPGHPSVWVWDTAPLILNAYLRVDPKYAEGMVRAQLTSIKNTGMMPLHVIEGLVRPDQYEDEITQIPLVADSAWTVFCHTKSVDFAQEAYRQLSRNYNWFEEQRKPSSSIPLWGIHDRRAPYFYGPESGLDNAAIYDDGPKYSVGINGAKFSFERAMEHFAETLSLPEEASIWRSRQEETRQFMLEHMWDEEAGFAYALYYDLRKKRLKSADMFVALYVGLFPEEMLHKTARTLEKEFLTDYGLTTTSMEDSTFDPEDMTRGSVWAFMNYMGYHGMLSCGENELAAKILAGTVRIMQEFPGAYESVNPVTRFLSRTKVGPMSYPRMSFSAAGMINMFYEREDERV